MTSTTVLLMLAELLGGLAFFMFGMNIMSGGLETMAGGALEHTLKKVTKSQFLSIFLGAGITIAIQSSSAMTVMLVGLVNSGIVNFCDSFGVIMGSNVGTTLTAWLLSLTGIEGGNFFLTLLKPMTFAPILAFVGIVLRMFAKSQKKHNIGYILIGFAILMTGMDFMSNSMQTVQEMPGFQSMLTAFGNSPLLALLVSMVFTGIIQSSAATIGIVQALALSGSISYEMAIPLVLGANIGTCITALISAFGTSKAAKRVVAMHIYVNVIGSVICLILLYIVRAFNPGLTGSTISMLGVAVVHTLFNTINTIVLVPFRKWVIRLCEVTVPDKKGETSHTVFLDERIFLNAPLACDECKCLTGEMAELVRGMMLSAIGLFEQYHSKTAEQINENEKLVDKYEDRLGTYLVRIGGSDATEQISHKIARMLHSIGDFERIGDHAVNLCKLAQEMHEKGVAFSENARNEIKVMTGALIEIVNLTVDAFVHDDAAEAAHVEPLEQVIDKLNDELHARHIDRLQNGICTIELGFILSDILTNYERIADHCSNLAVYTVQLSGSKLDTHKYLRKVKSEKAGAFVEDYRQFEQKYALSEE